MHKINAMHVCCLLTHMSNQNKLLEFLGMLYKQVAFVYVVLMCIKLYSTRHLVTCNLIPVLPHMYACPMLMFLFPGLIFRLMGRVIMTKYSLGLNMQLQ